MTEGQMYKSAKTHTHTRFYTHRYLSVMNWHHTEMLNTRNMSSISFSVTLGCYTIFYPVVEVFFFHFVLEYYIKSHQVEGVVWGEGPFIGLLIQPQMPFRERQEWRCAGTSPWLHGDHNHLGYMRQFCVVVGGAKTMENLSCEQDFLVGKVNALLLHCLLNARNYFITH